MNSPAILSFEKIVVDVSAGNKKVQKNEYLPAGRYPVVDQGQTFVGGYSDDENNLVASDGPWIVFGDHTRAVKYIDFPFCMGADGVKVLKPRDKLTIDTKYIYHFLLANEIPSAGYSRHFKFLKQIEIPLPRLDEQRKIAAILDKADELRHKRKRAIELLDSLTQSIFLEMFGDGVKSISTVETTISDACVKITDGTHHSPRTLSAGVPYVTAKHVNTNGLDFYSDPWFVSPQDHAEIYSRCNPEPGDVLYIKDGATTGVAAINQYDFPFSMLSSLALLKVSSEKCMPEFMVAWLNNKAVKKYMIGLMAGAGITRLTLAKIKSAPIALPPIEKQRMFADATKKGDVARKAAVAALDQSDVLFASLQRRAFSGQL